jgi:hypothetical protein
MVKAMGMALLPESSNARYRGMAIAWRLLLLHAMFEFTRGGIHFFGNDSVISRIAAVDLNQGGALGAIVLLLFSLLGLDQMTWSVGELWVALRQRAFVPLLSAVMLMKQVITVIVMWLYKPLPATVPAKYIQLAILPVLAIALWASMREPNTRG